MQPKTLKLAAHEHKVFFNFKSLKKYSSREPVPLKRWVLFTVSISVLLLREPIVYKDKVLPCFYDMCFSILKILTVPAGDCP
jgi:hypothetical protein